MIGTETGAPWAGRGLNGATNVLLIAFWVKSSRANPPRLDDAPFPAHELGNGLADRARQRLDPRARVVEGVGLGDRDPDLDAPLPAELRHALHAQVIECGPMKAGEDQEIVVSRLRTGVEVDERPRRVVRVLGRRAPRMHLDGAVVRRPRQCGGGVEDEVLLRLTGASVVVVPALEPVGRVGRRGLVPEPGLFDAVRKAPQVDGPAGEVGEHRRRNRRVVPDEVAFGERAARLLRGEQHLVEVRELQRACPDGPLAPVPSASRAASSSGVGPAQIA